MAKAFPIGTIRDWETGTVIKACEPSKHNHFGWIPLQTSQALESIGRECDSLASSCKNLKEPISGEIFLDHEIDNFEKDANGKHPYTANDFKKYEGFYGAGRYSFRNEFSRRFMAEKIALQEAINLAYDNAMPSDATEGLDAATKKAIRREVEANFSYNYEPFKTTQANELKGIIERTKKQLDIGFNFEGEQKKVYDDAISVVKSLPLEYNRLAFKKKEKENALKSINETFKDNWGVRETVKKKLDDAYGEYVRKFSERIREDEGKSQEETFGVTIDEPYETFYPKLFDKIQLDRDKFNKYKVEDIDLNKYEGEEIVVDGELRVIRKDKNGKFYYIHLNYEKEDFFNNAEDYVNLSPDSTVLIHDSNVQQIKKILVDKLNMFDLLSQHIGEEVSMYHENSRERGTYRLKQDKNKNFFFIETKFENRKDILEGSMKDLYSINLNHNKKLFDELSDQFQKQEK